jgi:hypothetical protein
MKKIKWLLCPMVLMTREAKELARDKIRAEERVASNSLRNLIYSIAMTVEDKYVLEDMLNKLSDEAHTMLDIINDIPRSHQKELLLGYRKVLESHIDATNQRLKEI